MSSYDTPTTVTSERPTADTVPLAALEAADRYARGSESLIEQARRLVGQLRDDVAIGRVQADPAKTFGLMQWRLISLGHVIAAMEVQQ
jgi:hypothetical protein